MRRKLVFQNESDAQAGQRCFDDMSRGVEDERAVYTDVQLAAIAFELPGVQTAIARGPEIDATMGRQIVRCRRRRVPGEIGRRGAAAIRSDGLMGSAIMSLSM